ncbi:septum site-determining protein MinC [Mesobacillus subterraneus]|nr:septum site-determining protein MinC [Mesobacillus subterraneus]MCM3683603.1 septum site-determining protein MinC [Mesobacillus subterraneus]
MRMKKTQNVTIKGTKDGLTLHLDDTCSYDELKKELDRKLSNSSRVQEEQQLFSVKVKVGNRYLTEKQEEELKDLIRQKRNLIVEDLETNVITKAEAERLRKETEIVPVARVIRSGQVLEIVGDLLLIGDVNPGGTVKATGNIFIMGALKGIAHAGSDGNEDAVIAASVMKPSQLRISDCINRAPDQVPDEENRVMECAYISDTQQIVVDRLQVLMRKRPNLTRFEGGL